MSKLKIAPDLEMHYRIDNFCDPWSEVETILLLHGIAESSLAWYRWIPGLASRFRIVRPDLRGFGKSTAMPADYPWSIDVIAKDVIALADKLKIDRFHLVGAKLGGTVAVRVAAIATKRVSSLSIIGSPVTAVGMLAESIPSWLRTIETTGIESWALSSMDARLGRSSPDAAKRWWAVMMAQTATTSLVGLLRALPQIDVTDDLDRICCRTMIVTGSGGSLGTIQEIRAWQERISNSRLVVLPTDAYHIAAAAARQVAERVVEFVESDPRAA